MIMGNGSEKEIKEEIKEKEVTLFLSLFYFSKILYGNEILIGRSIGTFLL